MRRSHRHRQRWTGLRVRRRAARGRASTRSARWRWPTPGPDTNGSQFFIITGPNGAALPPDYTLFGKVTEGLDTTVPKLDAAGNPENNGVPPLEPVTIESITITESDARLPRPRPPRVNDDRAAQLDDASTTSNDPGRTGLALTATPE